jgi:zinc/manganese transport system ATP-binding protein
MTAETASVPQAPPRDDGPTEPAVLLRGAQLGYGPRVLWDSLDLAVRPGEFIAIPARTAPARPACCECCSVCSH